MNRTSKHLAGFPLLVALGALFPVEAPAQKKGGPVSFEPPPGMKELFRLLAEGTQVYEWKEGKEAGKFAWAFRGPVAELFDDHGNKFGTHYAGPTWEAKDKSKVRGEVLTSRAAANRNAIPWLLLKVTMHVGKGELSKVRYIQRVDTWPGAHRLCLVAGPGRWPR